MEMGIVTTVHELHGVSLGLFVRPLWVGQVHVMMRVVYIFDRFKVLY